MLKNIDPLVSRDLLMVLRSMGHGDEIIVVEANFPAAYLAQRLVRLDGLTVTAVTDAILSVMPLDDFVHEAAWRMEVVGTHRPSSRSLTISGLLLQVAKVQAAASPPSSASPSTKGPEPLMPSWRPGRGGSTETSS